MRAGRSVGIMVTVRIWVFFAAGLIVLGAGCDSKDDSLFQPSVWIDPSKTDLLNARLEIRENQRFRLAVGVSEYMRLSLERSGVFREKENRIILQPDQSKGEIEFRFEPETQRLHFIGTTDEELKTFFADVGLEKLELTKYEDRTD